jgi:exopolyphosphatase/guanosine-5'-triphosphate,3'-diphosphate pyrophosphatase
MELGTRLGRDAGLPPALVRWTAPLNGEGPADEALRIAACWVADSGSRDHPEYRAEQSLLRLLRLHGVGLDHHARAFLALVAALRYEAEPALPELGVARGLLSAPTIRRAEVLGAAFRLAFTLCGGVPGLLEATALEKRDGRLVLRLAQDAGVFAGEAVQRRVEALAMLLGMEGVVEA